MLQLHRWHELDCWKFSVFQLYCRNVLDDCWSFTVHQLHRWHVLDCWKLSVFKLYCRHVLDDCWSSTVHQLHRWQVLGGCSSFLIRYLHQLCRWKILDCWKFSLYQLCPRQVLSGWRALRGLPCLLNLPRRQHCFYQLPVQRRVLGSKRADVCCMLCQYLPEQQYNVCKLWCRFKLHSVRLERLSLSSRV